MTIPEADTTHLDMLIGTWRTQGEILDDDGSTAIATVEGTDAYEWLGRSFVIHRADVHTAPGHTRP